MNACMHDKGTHYNAYHNTRLKTVLFIMGYSGELEVIWQVHYGGNTWMENSNISLIKNKIINFKNKWELCFPRLFNFMNIKYLKILRLKKKAHNKIEDSESHTYYD